MVALQKEQGNNLSPDGSPDAKAERLTQGTANLETIVEAAKPLVRKLDEIPYKSTRLAACGARAWALPAKEMRCLGVGEADQHSTE